MTLWRSPVLRRACYLRGNAKGEAAGARVRRVPRGLHLSAAFERDRRKQRPDCYAIADGGVCERQCSLDAGSASCPPGYGCDAVVFDFTPVDEGICFPVSDAGCNVSGRGQIFTICNSSADCECPTVCCPDAGQPACAFPCSAASDCPDPTTTCHGGFCEPNPCGALGAKCDASGAGSGLDGICEAMGYPTQALQCIQGGSATGSCDPNASRSDPSELCQVPELCNPRVDGGSCGAPCDPSAQQSSCPAPQVCFPVLNGSFLPEAVHQGTCAACIDIQGSCDNSAECCSGVCDQTWFVCL